MRFSSDQKRIGFDVYVALSSLTLAYFVLRLIYYAFSISPAVPPDEATHFAKSVLYSKVWLLPQDTPASYPFGLITHMPYLYYLVMGKILLLNVFSIPDLVFLRLANGFLCLGTVLYGYKWLRLSTDHRLCLLLYLVAITNTAMFTFLGASVSYDNLTNFLAIVAVYYLHLFFINKRAADLMLFLIIMMAGPLSKFTYLPLIPPLLFILIIRGRRALVQMWREWRLKRAKIRWPQILLPALALLFLLLNLQIYLVNLIEFHRIIPRQNQVLSNEQAMQYRIFARGKIFSLYKWGDISFDAAMAMADSIEHVKDREDTKIILRMAREQKEHPVPVMNRFQYFRPWLVVMVGSTVGIMGHQNLIKYGRWASIFQILGGACLLAVLLGWRPRQAGGRFTDAIILILFYGAILSQYVCYSNYLGSGIVELSLQGRYIFPVIILMYASAAYYLTVPWPRPFQYYAAIVTGVIFVISDFPFFLHSVTPIWFR